MSEMPTEKMSDVYFALEHSFTCSPIHSLFLFMCIWSKCLPTYYAISVYFVYK